MNEESLPTSIDIAERMWPYLGEKARKLINTRVRNNVLQFDRGEDGEIYQLAPIWDKSTQDRPKQKYSREIHIVLTLAKVVHVDHEEQELPMIWVERFAKLINKLADADKIKYGTLLPPLSMVLAKVPNAGHRIMVLLYCYSDLEKDDLNEWLGNKAFIKEGGIGTDDWSGLPE